MMAEKTLAMKLLEQKKVPFEAISYPPEEHDAEKLALLFGVPAAQVFKTLVVVREGNKKPLLVLTPADRQLDLKKVARALGEKKVQMALHSEAERLTGLQVGGISPLALLNRGFVICADATIRAQEAVWVSAGQRGINLRVPVAALLRLLNARIIEAT
jgi:Cys-tRNA(Pro)/Cys-tRNA(Cys) deacylase